MNKTHKIAQLKTQNHLKSKYNQIRFKFIIFSNRLSSIQKIEIFVQKQSVLQYYLLQYIINEKYMKNSIF